MSSSKKWSPVDPMHFAGKSNRDLEKCLREAEKFVACHPQFECGWHNEYRQELKRRIAMNIGVKK